MPLYQCLSMFIDDDAQCNAIIQRCFVCQITTERMSFRQQVFALTPFHVHSVLKFSETITKKNLYSQMILGFKL